MAAVRKLQAEVDKVLKKVDEGLEEFQSIWENFHSAAQPNQREKFETELKVQIKKLQRDREQIKIWLNDKTIKDKSLLTEARKKIENDMERFKEFERDAKTKTYSKEGLSKSNKMDPHEEERNRHRSWIQDYVDKLNVHIDEIDADLEAQAQTTKKSKKKDDDSGKSHLKFVQETHRWHATKLEQMLRKLDNDEVTMEDLDELRDSVEYYVDENSLEKDEFQTFEEIYDAFALEDVEDYLTKDSKEQKHAAEKEIVEESAVADAKPDKKAPKEGEPEPTKPAKSPKAAPATTPTSGGRRKGDKDAEEEPKPVRKEEPKAVPKPWHPAQSVWQNLPPAAPRAEREKAPPLASPGPPPKPSASSGAAPGQGEAGAPGPPPPHERPPPAPERPPPPGQAPVLNAPPGQPPPKPAPPPQHQLPPTQAPPLPSLLPAGGPPQARPAASVAGAMSMPAPPPMPPPAPQDGAPGTTAAASPPASPPPPAGAQGGAVPTPCEPPSTAPPPPPPSAAPPPPVLPPPPPSMASAPGGPPASSPPAVLSSAAAEPAKSKPPPPGVEREPPQWPPPAAEDRPQRAPSPPSEAPPPPSESPPPPPPGGAAHDGGAAADGAPAAPGGGAAALEPGRPALPSWMPPPPPAPGTGSRPADGSSAGGLAAASSADAREARIHELLAASQHNLPAQADRERSRKYVPRNPYVHADTGGQAAYPVNPTSGYEDPGMFEKYDLDTLFFIFYYQQGTYQQHLAARELKKLSWRYNTKYFSWFLRHQDPVLVDSEFEQGSYVYFDVEKEWCQRIKHNFKFEYEFLEDEPM